LGLLMGASAPPYASPPSRDAGFLRLVEVAPRVLTSIELIIFHGFV
jgi:hypothetical protein